MVGTMKLGHIVIAGAVLSLVAASPAAADVQITMQGGKVSIVAKDATLRQIMAEWARVGQTKVINLGNIQEVTIMQLAERVRELSGSSSIIKCIPYEEAYESGFEDMPRRVPDLGKIRSLIGYEPKVGLDEIIARVVDDFRSR